MSLRVFQSSTSHPSLDWESLPIIRPGGEPVRHRQLWPAIIAGFMVGFAIGVMF